MWKKNRGIGLIELMLALSIIAVLLVAATRYYLVTHQSQQINAAVVQIEAIASASQAWWNNNQHDLTSLTDITLLVDKGYLSKDYQQSIWGKIEVKGVDKNHAEIALRAIPTKACVNLKEKFKINFVCLLNNRISDFIICVDGSKNYSLCSIS